MDQSVLFGTPYFAQGLAAFLIGRECGEVIIGCPPRELSPFHWLELSVRKFQRFFSRRSIGRHI
jgi:hypothetical protein